MLGQEPQDTDASNKKAKTESSKKKDAKKKSSLLSFEENDEWVGAITHCFYFLKEKCCVYSINPVLRFYEFVLF